MTTEPIPVAVNGDEPECPVCHVTWIGEPIPENRRQHFGGATHGGRAIAIYDRDLDRTTHFKCPDCGHLFDRA